MTMHRYVRATVATLGFAALTPWDLAAYQRDTGVAMRLTPEWVGVLRPVCMYEAREFGPLQTSPLAFRGALQLTTAHSTIAFDAASCRLRWVHVGAPRDTAAPFTTNPGPPFLSGAALLAFDQLDGRLLWSQEIADPQAGELLSAPPLYHQLLVLIGAVGSERTSGAWPGPPAAAPYTNSVVLLDLRTGLLTWHGVRVTSREPAFLALDARTGEVRCHLGADVGTGAMTFAVGSRRYVAIVSGYLSPLLGTITGGTTTVIVFAQPDP